MGLWKWIKEKGGLGILSLEIIGITVLFIIFFCFLRQQWKDDKAEGGVSYDFIGLSGLTKFPPYRRGKKRRLSPHSNMEEKCRRILQSIYRKPFPSIRPSFLKNPATGQNLEFDCYNEELQIALEYDGAQHSKYNPYFHRKGPQEFLYQAAKDDYKTAIAKKMGITLIRVPHWIPEHGLYNYIDNKLREAGKL